MDEFFINHFLNAQRTIPLRIYLDLDATDDRIHGMQEGRHFNGYYDDYCYCGFDHVPGAAYRTFYFCPLEA
ncbi:MAG: transposase [Acidobacteriota bacterium]